ncbi:MAG: D-2-hydroxyacid dehydrogenase [Acidobacteria bacterium]|nr:D-2-hydroxyacid dehydrogenase [Acidobacteriota bacterium]
MRVLVLARPDAPQLSVLKQLPADVEVFAAPSADQLMHVVEGADVIVNGNHHAGALEALWPHAKSLRWVHSLSAGVESIVFPALKASPIPLTNARGVYKRSLAEFAIFGMLWFAKNARRLVDQQAASSWEQWDCEELTGKTCAILSYGAMGQETARRASAMGMKIIATRRRVDAPIDDFVSKVLPPSQTGDAMAEADYVVCCSPLTPETHHMIGAAEFARMKPRGVFLNIGRGAVVDEAALIDTLQRRAIKGAALDVFEVEPLPKESPLWLLDNVLLSPHCTDHTDTWQFETVQFFVDNFHRFVKGEPLENVVDKEAGY